MFQNKHLEDHGFQDKFMQQSIMTVKQEYIKDTPDFDYLGSEVNTTEWSNRESELETEWLKQFLTWSVICGKQTTLCQMQNLFISKYKKYVSLSKTKRLTRELQIFTDFDL